MADKLTIYIAGPISNTPDFRERFLTGSAEVVNLGHAPINPLEVCTAIDAEHGAGTVQAWLPAMKANIRALLECDGIYLLRGWENSRGARLEKLIADGLGMLLLYQSGEERNGQVRN